MLRGLLTCILMFGLLLVFAIGCSGGGTPILPPTETQIIPGETSRPGGAWEGNRVSWGMYLCQINEDHTAIDVHPLRAAQFHINVQPFVEYLFCTDCLRITNITGSGHGTLLVDIMLTHPFDVATDLTGFDVRGTAIFDAELIFPNTFMPDDATQLTASKRVLNADGWTTHFNAEDPGFYEKGKLVAPWVPDPIGNLHPFMAFWTDANRRQFNVGQNNTRTYDIDLPPGAFTFGYSVDASWEPPSPNPPVTIPDDFPITANSVEAFWLSPNVVANGLTRVSGSAVLEIEVFDWQDSSTIDRVFVEAPTLFPGTIDMTPTGAFTPISATYSVVLNNVNQNAPTTTGVDVLVCAIDVEYTASTLDLRAFNIVNLPVIDVPAAWRPRGGVFHNIPLAPIVPDGVVDFGVANPDMDPGPGVDKQCRVYIKKDTSQEFWRYNNQFNSAFVFAGYPGGAGSWMLPTSRMDVINSGVMMVHTESWGQELQPALDNYHRSLSSFFWEDGTYNHSWYSKADLPGDPNDYQEMAIDPTSGWGDKFGDPGYVLYAYEPSASDGGVPADVSILSIRQPYNDGAIAIRTSVPRGIGPGFVDENTVLSFAFDDQPGLMPPNSNLAYVLDDDGIEVFEVFFVSLPSNYQGTIPTGLIPVPGVFPIDIECLPAYHNKVYTGAGFAQQNWIAVLLDVSLMNQFVVGILEWDVGSGGPNLLATTLTYPGTPLAMDVDIEAFEIYVLADNGGVIEASVFEYY
jgi:hypothetical protein